jgi:hypothetical protein
MRVLAVEDEPCLAEAIGDLTAAFARHGEAGHLAVLAPADSLTR